MKMGTLIRKDNLQKLSIILHNKLVSLDFEVCCNETLKYVATIHSQLRDR